MNDPIISTRTRMQCCHRTHIPLIDSLASRRRRSATRSPAAVAVGALYPRPLRLNISRHEQTLHR
jgi:hypothetical protein